MKRFIFILVFFLGLTFFSSRPLINYFSKGIPYTANPLKGHEVVSLYPGDHLQLYYHFWLLTDALDSKHKFFDNPYEFNFAGRPFYFTFHSLPLSLIFALLYFMGGAFAYNFLIVASLFLSGIAGYLLGRRYGKTFWAGIMGGTIALLFPYRTDQLMGGHQAGFVFFILPLSVYIFEKFLESKKIYFGILLICLLLTLSVADIQSFYFGFLFVSVFFFLKLLFFAVREKAQLKSIYSILIVLTVAVVISVGASLTIKKLSVSPSSAKQGRSLKEVALYSPRPEYLIFKNHPNAEKHIYIGIVPLLLIFLGVPWYFFKERKSLKDDLEFNSTILFSLIAFIASTYLILGLSIDQHFHFYKRCYWNIPYFNFSRVPSRIIINTYTFLIILFPFSISYIVRNLPRKKNLKKFFRLGILIFLMFDYGILEGVGISLLPKEDSITENIKDKLKENPEGRLLGVPIWPGDSADSSVYEYEITQTKAPFLNGYSPLVPENYKKDYFWNLMSINVGAIGTKEALVLEQEKIRLILFNQGAFARKVSHFPFILTVNRLISKAYLTLIAHQGRKWLFELKSNTNVLELPVLSSPAGALIEARTFKAQRGKIISDEQAEDKTAYELELNSKNRVLVQGEKQILPQGNFIADFRIKAAPEIPFKRSLIFEVRLKQTNKVFSQKIGREKIDSLAGRYVNIAVPFESGKADFPEFIIRGSGEGKIWFDHILLIYEQHRGAVTKYEAEDMFFQGIYMPDAQAGNKKAVFASPETLWGTAMLFGPYRWYSPGDWLLSFYIRIKNGQNDNLRVGTMEVTANWGKEQVTQREIYVKDFKREGYTKIDLPFSLLKEKLLEFRLKYHKSCELWIDRVEVKKRELKRRK